ncbi:MAG: CHAT domain-containing protein [Bacteroidales bacterium]|nr:CHAT domain-containing protein [Bacteroidales bacterium]
MKGPCFHNKKTPSSAGIFGTGYSDKGKKLRTFVWVERELHRRSVPGFFLVLLVASLVTESLHARGKSPGVHDTALVYFRRADSLDRAGQWQKTIPLYRAAEMLYQNGKDTVNAWQCRYKRIMAFINLRLYDSVEKDIHAARLLYEKDTSKQNTIHAELLFLQGYYAYKAGKTAQAISFLSRLLHAKDYHSVYANRYLAYCYFELGDFLPARDNMLHVLTLTESDTLHPVRKALDLHWLSILYTYYLGNRSKGLHYLNLAGEQYRRAHAAPETFSKLYNEMGTISMENGDYSQARDYYIMAVNNLPSAKKNTLTLARIYNNLGIVNHKMGRYHQAETYLSQSLTVKKQINNGELYATYINLGNLYLDWNKTEKANDSFRKSIENIKQQYGKDNWRLADLYQNYGWALIHEYRLAEGRSYLVKALKLYQRKYGERHPKTARCYLKLEGYYWKKELPDSALFYIQKSMIANSPHFNSKNIFENPSPDKVFSREIFLSSLKDKANRLEAMYERDQDLKYLQAALQSQQEAVDLVKRIRQLIRSTQSRLLIAAHEEDTYQNAFLLAVRLYRVTGRTEYLYRAFGFSEESRASDLLSAIRTTRAITYAGIPGTLLSTENDLTEELGAYEELLYKERNKVDPDPKKIRTYETRAFRLRVQKDSLIRDMEKKYPRYYRLKYDISSIPVGSAMKQLKNDQAILEYEIIRNRIYIFCLTKNKLHLIMHDADPDLDGYIGIFWKELQQRQFNKNAATNFFDLTYSSYNLYQNLISPVDSLIRGKSLIIVPDEKVAVIPFGVLISQITEQNMLSYRKLPYLIYQHPITYSYSSTLYFEHLPRRRKFFNRTIAFAPEYPKQGLDLHQIMQARQSEGYHLYPLPFARKEAEEVCHYTLGRMISGKQASEHYFKNHTSRYDIIHLAMHTILDNQHPLYSKLVFTQPPDSLEDGFLNTYEIYTLQFRTNLVVLSACNSGSGKLSKGEGIMSLARSFMYAGGSRLIMSLWEIQDRTGATIMSLFYKNLVRGLPIDRALQKAKITYLESADPLKSSPYFWAGYQVMGNAAPVYFPFYYFIILTVIVMAAIILFISYLRKKHSARL